MTLELTSLIPLVGSLVENPLAVKHLDNRLYISMTVSKIRVPILNVNMANTFSARVIMPINMMVHVFINLTSLLMTTCGFKMLIYMTKANIFLLCLLKI